MDCGDLKELFEKISKNVEEVSGNIYFFFHYPFHDLRHCKEMNKYFDELRNNIYELESAELWLLRMSIYLHDIGMFLNPRNWHKLGISRDMLSSPGEDLIEDLTEDPIVKSFLDNLGMSFENAFFDENNCLRLPPPLKGKPWDEFSLVEKVAVRTVMRKLHPQIGDWAVRKKFIGEYPLECRKVSETIGGMIRLHEDESDERIRNLGSWEIAESNVDQKKLAAILILLDSLDCAGQSRASPEALDEIIDEVRMLEEKEIELEAAKSGSTSKRYEHLPHWVFKKYIKKVEVGSGRITVVTDTSSSSYLAGILFFEIANSMWPKYALASKILEEYGYRFDLVVRVPGSVYSELLVEEDLMGLGKEFSKIIVETSELPKELREKYKLSELKLPRALALLLSYGGSYNEYADQLAKRHVCRLLTKLDSEQKNQLEKIFKCS